MIEDRIQGYFKTKTITVYLESIYSPSNCNLHKYIILALELFMNCEKGFKYIILSRKRFSILKAEKLKIWHVCTIVYNYNNTLGRNNVKTRDVQAIYFQGVK